MLSVAPRSGPDGQVQLHASTVVLAGRAISFAGPSGAGKSSAALAMMAHGATLLADDVTWYATSLSGLVARCPPALSGRIEARGVGILNAAAAPPTPLALIVDLGTSETERLPPRRMTTLLGHEITLLHAPNTPGFTAAILQYMSGGRAD